LSERTAPEETLYDQSFNSVSLGRELRRSDFLFLKQLRDPIYRAGVIAHAVSRSQSGFNGYSLLSKATLKGKPVFFPKDFSDELLLRKIGRNVERLTGIQHPNRDLLVANLRTLISEGLPYRIYRLDLKSFYESVTPDLVQNAVGETLLLSTPTKRHVEEILTHHSSSGYPGLPRGIGLSAILAELVMKRFDQYVSKSEGVYFYGRFVDDIIVLTNGLEVEREFLRDLAQNLPKGLILNKKKQDVLSASKDVSPFAAGANATVAMPAFDYLGYRFNVWEPPRMAAKKPGDHFRDVWLDIADSKVGKIKTRIVRSVIGYLQDGDFDLLEARIKYLTTNFSVPDSSRERKRLAGIFHNYWQVDSTKSKALFELDNFLKKAVISARGKIFDAFYSKTSEMQRRRLLTNSFVRGFKEKTYLYFSREQIIDIQRCWNYA
jgi:hypothetical protein